jgi:ankyrin repeat protein
MLPAMKTLLHGYPCAQVRIPSEKRIVIQRCPIRALAQNSLALLWLTLPLLTGCATIYDSTKNGDVAAIQKYLQNGGNPNAKDEYGRTLLNIAAYCSNPELVTILIDKGATINPKGENDTPPLMSALGGNPARYGEQAYKSGKLTVTFYPGDTLDLSVMRILIDRGADLEAKGYQGRTALIECLSGTFTFGDNKLGRVKLLLEKGANVNAKDKYGTTPLLQALCRELAVVSTPEIARLLVDKGADVNARNYKAETPLMLAADLNCNTFGSNCPGLEVAKLLVAKGADVNAVDKDGRTALTRADSLLVTKEIATFLREHGAKR